MDQKPLVPKSLARRIRRAQEQLNRCIQTHIWAEKDIPELRSKLEAFSQNPEQWASLHYPNCGGASSYPVLTHISRSVDSLERKLARRSRELDELKAAQDNLETVEKEVLLKVSTMRPTPGRVPWPEPISDIETQRQQLHLELEKSRLQAEEDKKLAEQDYKDEMALNDISSHEEDILTIQETVSKGPEYVIIDAMTRREIKKSFQTFVSSGKYQEGSQSGWTGGLNAFLGSLEYQDAQKLGLENAQAILQHAKGQQADLWETCLIYGFYTPSTVPHC